MSDENKMIEISEMELAVLICNNIGAFHGMIMTEPKKVMEVGLENVEHVATQMVKKMVPNCMEIFLADEDRFSELAEKNTDNQRKRNIENDIDDIIKGD